MKSATPPTAPIPQRLEAQPESEAFEYSFNEVRAEIEAFPDNKLVPINLDVPSLVIRVIGVAPNVQRFREQAAITPSVDVIKIDKLDTYARALGHAHSHWLAASSPEDLVPRLMEELTQIRSLFVSDIAQLAKRGLMDASKLKSLRGPQKVAWMFEDVEVLVKLLHANWSAIDGLTGVTLSELVHANRLVQELISAACARKKRSEASIEWGTTRQKAFSVLFQAYFEARRFVRFCRAYEGDAEVLAPSLYAGRPYKRKKSADAAPPQPPITPAASLPLPSEQPPLVSRGNAAPGMPGDHPFDPVH